DISATISGASAGKAAAAVAAELGVGAATLGIGLVVGAVVGEAIQLLHARKGRAEKNWDSLYPQLLKGLTGSGMTELTFAEGIKGMADVNNLAMPGCGADRHKNADCFMAPLAQAIIAGYVAHKVPLTAGTDEVFQSIVIPWLQAGGTGGFNWQVLSQKQPEMLMWKAATDRYLNGMPITRIDMVEPKYKGQPGTHPEFHTPSLVEALVAAGVLQNPATATNVPASITSENVPLSTNVIMTKKVPLTVGQTPIDQTPQLIAQLLAQGASQQQAIQAALQNLQSQGVNTSDPSVQNQVAADVSGQPVGGATPQRMATAGISGLPSSWLAIGAGLFVLSFALARPAKRGEKIHRSK
ncbi:MAG: hypothetical protein ACREQ5_33645, partial [Candidatus Dormibacteria bacterium]